MRLCFDTETTGLPAWDRPSEDPSQPHIIQLALIELDDDLAEQSARAVIVRPDDTWIMSPEAAAVHGIALERAMDEGIPAPEVFDMLDDAIGRATFIAAHNISFDARMVRIMAFRLGKPDPLEARKRDLYCTMTKAGGIMKLPPTARMVAKGLAKFKPPNLGECVRHFFGEELPGAHDAMVDAQACARICRELRRLALVTT